MSRSSQIWLAMSRPVIIISTFYPNGCQFENPKMSDFEKIASASSSFSTLSLPLPTSFITVLPLPQKINRFRRFHIPVANGFFYLDYKYEVYCMCRYSAISGLFIMIQIYEKIQKSFFLNVSWLNTEISSALITSFRLELDTSLYRRALGSNGSFHLLGWNGAEV